MVKIRVNRDVFVEAATWVARSASTQAASGVITGVLIETHDADKIRMGATDGITTGKNLVGVEVVTEGKVVLPARTLSDFARTLPSGTVELSIEGKTATLSCGAVTFKLQVLPLAEYPVLVKMPAASGVVAAEVFSAAVAQVAVAASRDDATPILTGVHVEMNGDKISLVAADRYRLAVRELTWSPADPDIESAVLVPRATLSDAAKSFSAAGSNVTIAVATGADDDNLIGFANSDSALITRQIDGEYIRWRGLLPEEFTSTVVVANDVLTASLKRAVLVASSGAAVRFTLDTGSILVEAGEGDSALKEEIPAEFDGESFSINFSPAFLIDGIAAAASEKVTIQFNGAAKAALITGADNFRYLLMPVRTSTPA